MKIGIDIRSLYRPDMKGIGIYLNNLLPWLGLLDTNDKYLLYFDKRQDNFNRKPHGESFQERGISIPKGDSLYFWEQLCLPTEIVKDKIDLFHSPGNTMPAFKRCKHVVTIHDTKIFETKPENIIDRVYTKYVQVYALKRADVIICPSEFTKKCVMSCLNIREDKIAVIYNGINDKFKVLNDKSSMPNLRERFVIKKGFILSVGGETPLKNISNLIASFAILKKRMKIDEQLVITGIRNKVIFEKHRQEILKHGIEGEVIILGYVDQTDLILLYNEAAIFVYPSLFEGFGFPPLEAMACGVPVAASDATSIPEVTGDAAVLFNGKDIVDMTEKISRLLTDKISIEQMRQKGFERIKMFTWKTAAEKTLQVYQRAL